MTARERQMLSRSVGYKLTTHARMAARARGFDLPEVLLTCVDPEVSYTACDRGPGRRVCQRGLVAVVVHEETRTVITVLLRDEEPWTDEQARSKNQPAA